MSLINVMNLSFGYDGSFDMVFENVSFSIDTDWRLGFIGRNGRGKTTFLNLLLGKYKYSGKISADVNFEYFPYTVKNKKVDTYDIIKEISPQVTDWEIICEFSLLDVPEDVLNRPFSTLSNGEQTKVLLAALFLTQNGFLLIDEPTNHLDESTRDIVKDYLKLKKGFILVSHDRRLLDECVDHILSINLTDIEIQKGNFSSWYENKKRRDNYELSENERLKKDIDRLSESLRENSRWSYRAESGKYGKRNSGLRPDRGYVGHKAAKMMKRAKNIEARRQVAAEEKSKLLLNIEKSENLSLSSLEYHREKLVEFSDVSLFYGEKSVCRDLSFSVNRGERVALRGKNGSGKSTILNMILGENIKYTGNFFRASGLKISYVSQDTSFLSGHLSEYAKNRNIDESLFKTILRKLDFERSQFGKDMSSFSEGQKKKVLIAASLCEKVHLYIWDEPLNFIDIISRIQIEELLATYSPTLIFVEHDSEFVKRTATKIIDIF